MKLGIIFPASGITLYSFIVLLLHPVLLCSVLLDYNRITALKLNKRGSDAQCVSHSWLTFPGITNHGRLNVAIPRCHNPLKHPSLPLAHVIKNDRYDAKESRVSLVLSDQGVEDLHASNVLLVGASQLAVEIATHLLRSGVKNISIWHCSLGETKKVLKEIKALQPDATVNILDREPQYDKDIYDAVVFVDRPLNEAIEINNKVRNMSKCIFVKSSGVYGVVLSDFGDRHHVATTSDMQHQEHQGTIHTSGAESVIEIAGKSGVDSYNVGDFIRVALPGYLLPQNSAGQSNSDTIVRKTKISHIEKVGNDTIRLTVDMDTNTWPNLSFSVRKLDPEVTFTFASIDTLTRKVLNKRLPVISSFMEWFKTSRDPPERLVIAPGSDNAINKRTQSVVASLLEVKLPYWKVDHKVIETFNVLMNVSVTPFVKLLGSLTAQEVIKGLTHTFTPSEVIIVDRSDIFPNGGVGLSVRDAIGHVKQPMNCDYLLVGAGALGCEYLKMLSSMNVTHVTILDNDTVDLSNLTRQTLFTTSDVGKSKAISALKNLRLFSEESLPNYVAKQQMFTEYFKMEPSEPGRPVIVLSAVDNIHSRLLLDNFSIENSYTFVEAGIHGMQCSTSIWLPYITDSYGSTIDAQAAMEGRNSCSVKGIPTTTEDTVFYAMELYSWFFNAQHDLFNDFMKNPLKTLTGAIQRDLSYFIKVVDSIIDNSKLATSELDIDSWAKKMYGSYFNIEFPLKSVFLEAMNHVKRRSICKTEPTPCKGPREIRKLISATKSLLKNHFRRMKDTVSSDLFKKCQDAVERLFNAPAVVRLLENGCDTSMQPLSFSENYNEDCKFIFAASNIRAYKFGIYQSDMATVVKVVKNIVPAISTTVSVAASMAMLEVYKSMPLLNKVYKRTDCDKKEARRNVTFGDFTVDMNSNTRQSVWCVKNKDDVQCFTNTRLVATMKLLDYGKASASSEGLIGNFFNLSIMKYFNRRSDPPALFRITNDNALLKDVCLSQWDHVVLHDEYVHSAEYDRQGLTTMKQRESAVTIGDIVEVVRILFGATVESLLLVDEVVPVTNENIQKTLRECFRMKGTCTIQLVAKDNKSMQYVELPGLKCAF